MRLPLTTGAMDNTPPHSIPPHRYSTSVRLLTVVSSSFFLDRSSRLSSLPSLPTRRTRPPRRPLVSRPSSKQHPSSPPSFSFSLTNLITRLL